MKAEFVLWIACYLGGYFGAWAFDKPPANTTAATQNTNYTFKISAIPTLNQIENINGTVLGELQTAKFAGLNQIESSNIIVNNQLTDNRITATPTPTLTPTLTPTPTPTPTPRSPASPAGRPSEVGPTPTITPKPTPTSTPLPTPILSPTPTPTPLAYEKTINDLSMALVANDSQVFYSLLSNEVTSSFTAEEIKKAFDEAFQTYGGITAVNPLSTLQQNGNWATQEVETITKNGTKSKFRIILHLENGEWKLFGTQEIP